VQTLKVYSGVELYLHLLLILALDGYESSALCPGYFTLGERVPGAGGLVIVGMDNLKTRKFCVHFSVAAYVLYTLPISSTVKHVVSHARPFEVKNQKTYLGLCLGLFSFGCSKKWNMNETCKVANVIYL